jgi:ADP-ribose pyrophosphatase YjhB (NUDIX family)
VGERIDYLDDPAAPEANSVVPSANVIVVNGHSEILMIRRTDNGNWAVPGGGMDLGESITDTAVRETREETGISCEITGLVGIYTSPRHVILYTSNGEARQEFSIRPASRRATAGQQRVGRTAMGCSRRHPGLADAPVDASAHPALSRQTAQALPRLNSEQLFDPPRRSQDLRSGQLNESCDLDLDRTGRGSRQADQQAGHNSRRGPSSCRSTRAHPPMPDRRGRTQQPAARPTHGPQLQAERTSGRPRG